MRILIEATFPIEPFNTLIRKGKAGETIKKIMDAIKPEAAYFADNDGCRCGIFIVQMESASKIPAFAEPLFLALNANVRMRVVMTPEDLAKSGLDQIAANW